MYGWSAEEAADKTVYLNNAMLQTNLDSEEYINLVKRMSASGDALNLSLEDKLNIINSLKKSGVDYRNIMRALRSGFTSFRKEVDPLDGKLSDAEKAMQSMGISMTDANGRVKTQKELLIEVMDKLSSMPAGYEKTKLATEVFGDSAGQIFSKLKEGPTEYGIKVNKMVDDTKKATDNIKNVSIQGIKDTKKAHKDMGSYLEGWLNKITTWFAGLPGEAKLAIQLAMGYFSGASILKFIPGDIAKKISNKIGLDALKGYGTKAIQGLWDGIKTGVGKYISPSRIADTIKSKSGGLGKKIWDAIKSFFKDEKGAQTINR
jgi:hypothetical protein